MAPRFGVREEFTGTPMDGWRGERSCAAKPDTGKMCIEYELHSTQLDIHDCADGPGPNHHYPLECEDERRRFREPERCECTKSENVGRSDLRCNMPYGRRVQWHTATLRKRVCRRTRRFATIRTIRRPVDGAQTSRIKARSAAGTSSSLMVSILTATADGNTFIGLTMRCGCRSARRAFARLIPAWSPSVASTRLPMPPATSDATRSLTAPCATRCLPTQVPIVIPGQMSVRGLLTMVVVRMSELTFSNRLYRKSVRWRPYSLDRALARDHTLSTLCATTIGLWSRCATTMRRATRL